MANLGKAFLSAIGKVAANSPLGENTEAGIEEFESNQDPLYISYYRQEGVHPEASKSGTCNYCLAMNGHMFRRSQLLQNDGSLGHHPGCLTGDTKVSFLPGDKIIAATRRPYFGNLFAITIAGKTSTLTPNHPVLTCSGWKTAAHIKKGDQVIVGFRKGIPESNGIGIIADGHYIEANTRIENVFASLRKALHVVSVPVKGSPEDFHGDGIIDKEINIIRSDRRLGNETEPVSGEEIRKGNLIYGTGLPGSLSGDGSLDLFGYIAFAPFGSPMSGFSDADGERRVDGISSAHFLGTSPDGNPPIPENVVNMFPGYIESLMDAERGFPGGIRGNDFVFKTVTDVSVKCVHEDAPIWVYNFETKYGIFMAGFATHNCKCTFVPVANEEAFFQGNPAKGPIEMTGEAVWQNPRARKGVGAKRLAQIPNKTLKEVLKKRNLAVGGNKTALLGRIFKGWL